MDAKQEFTLYWMKLGRRCLEGSFLEECEKEIKEVEDWAASGNPGLPARFYEKIVPVPMKHESKDGKRCGRCGIEKIYWEHFPDCGRFNDQNSV